MMRLLLPRFLLIFLALFVYAIPCRTQDSLPSAHRSAITAHQNVTTDTLLVSDTASPRAITYCSIIDSNKFLNTKGLPSTYVAEKRNFSHREWLFYGLVIILFFFGIIRLVFNRYFTTLFRVFFNTSLRQSQLKDQMIQSKLQSLLFNLLFIVNAGFFLYVLAGYYGLVDITRQHQVLWLCMAAVAIVYLSKYIVLKFIGWLSGYQSEASSYIFIVFLINKIMGIGLLPALLILTFSNKQLADVIVQVTYFMIILMFLLRYIRAYGLLQIKLKLNRFHFLIYILATEFIPLLLLFKIGGNILVKYL